jgi:terminase, large subunit
VTTQLIKFDTYWKLDEAEVELLTPRPEPDIVEWAQENIYIPQKESPTAYGYLNIEYSPYISGPLRALTDNYTREVWIRGLLQSAKSFVSMIFLCYRVANDPGPFMLCMPDENTVKRRFKARLRPFFESNKFLMEQLDGKIENLNIGEVTTLLNMNLYIAWARSVAVISDVPIRDIVADEVKIFPENIGTDVDSISLLRGRQMTFPNTSKFLGMSSPKLVGDLFDKNFNDGLIYEYWLRCPVCDRDFLPDIEKMSELKLDKEKDGSFLDPNVYENDREGRYAWFECPLCNNRLSETDRAEATSYGKWVPQGCSINSAGKIKGKVQKSVRKSFAFHPFMIHPRFQPLWRLAADFVRTMNAYKAGDRIKLQNFRNNQQGLPWKVKSADTAPPALLKRVEDYPAGTVPVDKGAQFLVAGVDVHLDYVWVSVDAFGYMAEWWTVWEGILETGDTKMLEHNVILPEFLSRTFKSTDGSMDVPVYLTAIDCGYRYDSVIAFCRVADVPVIPVRGSDHVTGRTFKRLQEKETGLWRFDLNVNSIKDRLYRIFFESDKHGPAYGHMHADTSQEVFDHMTSEERLEIPKAGKMVDAWTKKSGRENHIWDCKVYAMAAAEISGLWQLQPPKESKAAQTSPKVTQQKNTSGYDRRARL